MEKYNFCLCIQRDFDFVDKSKKWPCVADHGGIFLIEKWLCKNKK